MVSVITCAHEEEKYLGKCLSSVRRVLKRIRSDKMFVADRCTDNTVKTVKKFSVTVLLRKTGIAKKEKSLEEDC